MLERILDKLHDFVNPWEKIEFNKSNFFSPKVILKKIYFWMDREHAIRYTAVLKELRKGNYADILEVGSGPLGLSRFISRKIVGVDLDMSGPHHQYFSLVGASVTALPFKEKAFDFVVSLDMLEHLPLEQRPLAVLELLRVARKKIILGLPCGDKARWIEAKALEANNKTLNQAKLSSDEKKVLLERVRFLADHVRYGLPYKEEIETYFQQAAIVLNCRYKLRIIENESIYVWFFSIASRMPQSYLRFIRILICIIFFPILARLEWPACYRKMFIAEKE